jgi:hypothetical protein
MKSALWIAVRVIAALVVAGLVLWFALIAPRQAALVEIDDHVKRLTTVMMALENGQTKFSGLPNTIDIKLQAKGAAKAYVYAIETAVSVVNVDVPAPPKAVMPYWRNEKIDQYNAFARNTDYAVALAQSAEALHGAQALINHHRAVMYAIANVLEYNPTEDTKSNQPEAILPALEAAAAGLEKTIIRINEAPQFKGDGAAAIIAEVRNIETARQAYYNAITADTVRVSGAEKDAYIKAVANAQHFILTNRQEFWAANREAPIKAMQKAREALSTHADVLRNM